MNKIDVESVFDLHNELAAINQNKIDDVVFIRDGKVVHVPEDVIEQHKFTGLSLDDFIVNYEWPDYE